MEIRNNPFEERARQAIQSDITRANRETIETSNLDLAEKAAEAAKSRDTLEVDSNRVVSERADRAANEADAERTERVRDLARAYKSGELNSPERVERAALRMLEGE